MGSGKKLGCLLFVSACRGIILFCFERSVLWGGGDSACRRRLVVAYVAAGGRLAGALGISQKGYGSFRFAALVARPTVVVKRQS